MKNLNLRKNRTLKLLVALTVALCVCLAATSAGFAAAGAVTLQDVIESPHVRIVIDGKYSEYTDVPLEISGRILLPLRECLTNLGVSNDDEHIIWNEDEQSVTVNHGDNVIKLVTGDPVMLLNGEEITFDVAPYNYEKNGRTYIPVRAVSELMDKLVLWEESTTTVYIRDKANHAETVEVLEQVQAAGEQTKIAADVDMNVAMSISSDDTTVPGTNDEGVMETNVDMTMRLEADLDEGIFYVSQQAEMLGMAINSEMFVIDGKTYANIGSLGEGWMDISDQGGLDMESTLDQAQVLASQFGERPLEDVAMAVACIKASNGTYSLVGEPINMGDINGIIDSLLQSADLGGMGMEMKINRFSFGETLGADYVTEKSTVTLDCDMSMSQPGADGNAAVIDMGMIMTATYEFEEVPEDFAVDIPAEVMALIQAAN